MGRHRRWDAGRAATGRATGDSRTHGSYQYEPDRDPWDSRPQGDDGRLGIAPYLNPDLYSDAPTTAPAPEYLFDTDDGSAHASTTVIFPADGFSPADGPRERGHRRKKKAATPVRTGLLGVSAAVALGTVAVATGAVPGLENYKLGGPGGGADKVQAAGSPTNSEAPLGGTSGSADAGGQAGGSTTSRGADRPVPSQRSASESAPASKPDAEASATPTKAPEAKPTTAPEKPETAPAETASQAAPAKTEAPTAAPTQAAVEAEVLRLVNEERAKVGCSALTASSALAGLAQDFSEAMAAENFFDHTDPSGASPWDRAAKLGITSLGGENIARGQADAAAVMDAWMNSPGHRANILNCDFKTLGVGVHFGSGGPWWTQDFGY
ncbi:CAP domain-containing protein [Streptomyces sp. NPDC017179]|uniref:CAP domain-containing protein n=1 Tax=Streptomyces sp. NPDC017179 TaxID=3364979 RepID=UPI0037A51728